MTTLRYLAAAALVAVLAGKASAAALADGVYNCYISSMMLGQIEIDGGVYRGPAFDGNFQGDYPCEVIGDTVNWGGPLGGITSDGNTVVSTVLKDAGGGNVGFDIMIRNARGNFQTISCSPE